MPGPLAPISSAVAVAAAQAVNGNNGSGNGHFHGNGNGDGGGSAGLILAGTERDAPPVAIDGAAIVAMQEQGGGQANDGADATERHDGLAAATVEAPDRVAPEPSPAETHEARLAAQYQAQLAQIVAAVNHAVRTGNWYVTGIDPPIE